MTRFILYFKRGFFLEYLYPSFFGENVQNQHCFDENLNRYSPEIINTMFYRDHCVCHTMMFAYCVSQRDFSALLMGATSQTSFFSYFTYLPSSPQALWLWVSSGSARPSMAEIGPAPPHGCRENGSPCCSSSSWASSPLQSPAVLLWCHTGTERPADMPDGSPSRGVRIHCHNLHSIKKCAQIIFFSFTCERGSGMWLLTAGIVKWLFPFLQMTGLCAPAKLELAEICSAAVC